MKLDYIPGKDLIGPDGFSRRHDHLDKEEVKVLLEEPTLQPERLNVVSGCDDVNYFGSSFEDCLLMYSILQIEPPQFEVVNAWFSELSLPVPMAPHASQQSPTALTPPADAHSRDPTGSAHKYNDTGLVGDPDLLVASALLELLKEATKMDATYKLVRESALKPDRQSHYEAVDGILFYKLFPSEKASARIFVPDDISLRYKIIYEYHDAPIQGHFGRVKTLERVRRHYYWPGMEQTIDAYIKSCDRCQRFKHRTHKAHSTAKSYKVPDYPWQVMTMDEKSGLPKTVRGNDAFWVFMDKLSKRGHFFACKHKLTSVQIARVFMDVVFKHHGIPEVIISDRDALFTASFWDTLWKLIGTNLNMSSTNSPQTDGQSERTIKTVVEMIANYAEAHPRDWDEFLPALEYAYNDSVAAATCFTPFELDMGRSPVTPIKMLAFGLLGHRRYFTSDDDGVNPRMFLERMSRDLAAARQRIYKQQIIQKRSSEKGTNPVEFKLGEWVYMEHPELHTPAHKSMDAIYIGPYQVIRKVVEGWCLRTRLAF